MVSSQSRASMRFRTPTLLTIFSVLAQTVSAAFYYDPSTLPNSTYDFIVVGSGPGGLTVANRLTEISSVRVLLIEAGPNDQQFDFNFVPGLINMGYPHTAINYNYTTVAQAGCDGRQIDMTRGHVLGGTSAINFLLQNKGSQEFWNHISTVTGDTGYTWNSMSGNYLKKFETFVGPTDGRSITGDYTTSAHGYGGPVGITLANYEYSTQTALIGAAGNQAAFPHNTDPNAGNMLGVSWAQLNQGGGLRFSSAEAYVHFGYYNGRANFDILVGTTVTKVNFATGSGTPTVNGVTVQMSSGSTAYTIHANQEVILSAGAINTPLILMLSGIGPSAQLRAQGINVVYNSPNVGQGLQDHPVDLVQWTVTSSATTNDNMYRNQTAYNAAISQWVNGDAHTGPMGNGFCSTWSWGRIASTDSIFHSNPDPSPGGNSPHWENLFCDGTLGSPPPTGNYLSVPYVVISPQARGNVTLASNSPFQTPNIDPGFLNNAFDLYAMRVALTQARSFIENSTSLHSFVTGRYGQPGNSSSEIDSFHQATVASIWHPCCTAQLGPNTTSTTVLNAAFQVRGVNRLRVVDASSFPSIPSGHPQGMIYALAERAADLIKAAHGYST